MLNAPDGHVIVDCGPTPDVDGGGGAGAVDPPLLLPLIVNCTLTVAEETSVAAMNDPLYVPAPREAD